MLRENDRLSRGEITHQTGLSAGTVSRIVADLIDRKFVLETGSEGSTGGRPATQLELNQSKFLAIGIDVQTWQTRISTVTMKGRILQSEFFRTPSTPEGTLDLIVEQASRIRSSLADGEIEGIGVGLSGIVNSRTGVLELGHDPGWVGVPVKSELEGRLHIPVHVDNAMRAAALAEFSYGNALIQGTHCLLYVDVEDGVGIAIVLDGHVYQGPRTAAGEFGQMIIKDLPGGETHNSPGCLEKLTSNLTICDRYQSRTGRQCGAADGESRARVRQICHAAMQGEPAALDTLRETARYLGIGIANVVWGMDAEVVVINGAITDAWPVIAPVIRSQFPDGQEVISFRDLHLIPSALGEEASILGAATLAFSSLFTTGERNRLGSSIPSELAVPAPASAPARVYPEEKADWDALDAAV